MKTIEWNEEQRKAFQDLLREFVALIDAKVQEKKQTGKTPTNPKYASYQRGLNKFLAPWGYACKISPGSHGRLSHWAIHRLLPSGYFRGRVCQW